MEPYRISKWALLPDYEHRFAEHDLFPAATEINILVMLKSYLFRIQNTTKSRHPQLAEKKYRRQLSRLGENDKKIEKLAILQFFCQDFRFDGV